MAPKDLRHLSDGHRDPSGGEPRGDSPCVERNDAAVDDFREHLDHHHRIEPLVWLGLPADLGAVRHLDCRPFCIGADIQILALEAFPPDAPVFDEVGQRVVNSEPEAELKFSVELACLGLRHHASHGFFQCARVGKEHAPVLPKTIRVELRNVSKCVVASCVAVAGEIASAESRRKAVIRERLSMAVKTASRSAIFWRRNRRRSASRAVLAVLMP